MDEFYQALGVNDAGVSFIRNRVEAGDKLSDALRNAQSDGGVDKSSRQRLLFVTEMVDMCWGDVDMCLPLIQDKSVASLNGVALKYYCAKDRLPAPVSARIRLELLYRVPTAVLSAAVNNGILKLEPAIQRPLSRILGLAVRAEVQPGSLGEFLVRPEVLDQLSQLSAEDRRAVRAAIETLFRLHALVRDAEDLRALVGTRFTSARAIALTKKSDFVEQLRARGLDAVKSAGIHEEAERIDRRNDAVWADIVRSRREIPVLAVTGIKSGSDAPPEPDNVQANLGTLFRDLDSVTADNSTSVLGPASYLVDLLQLLRGVSVGSCALGWQVSGAKTMLDIFLHRRPDIAAIELSKAHVETPVTYQELAIQVMESHLSRALNPAKDSTWSIYAAVSKRVAPMVVFPYNHAITTSRAVLRSLGYSRHELLRRFQSDQSLVQRAFPKLSSARAGGDYLALARVTHARRLAAESLGLQPLDFQAITQEAIHSRDFIRLLQEQRPEMSSKTYQEMAGLSLAGEYWGYEADKGSSTGTTGGGEDDGQRAGTPTWKMLNPSSKVSLRLIKEQLLARSNLTPSELNIVLKTRYISNRLVITLAKTVAETVNGEPTTVERFSDELRDMRLQESPLVLGHEEAAKLSRRTCLDLQAFIRLRSRLAWSVEATDAAVAALARRAQVYENDPCRHHVLDGDFVERLAAAQQLSVKTAIPLLELLPFWGPMYAQFPTSLYARLFLRTGLVERYPNLALADGEVLPEATFGQNMGAVLEALRMTQAEQLALMEMLGFEPATPWALEAIAKLYSYQRLCKLLCLPAKRYAEWWNIACQQQGLDPFLEPQSALAALDLWLDLPEGIPSAQAALDLLVPLDATRHPGAPDLAVIGRIAQGIADIESQYAATLESTSGGAEETQVYTCEALLSMCSRKLSPSVSTAIADVVDGTSMFTPIALGPSTADNLGIRIFAHNFRLDVVAVISEFQKPVLGSSLQEREQSRAARRKQAMVWMVPELKRPGTEAIVRDSLAARFPGTDPEILQQLLLARDPTAPGGTRSAHSTYLESLENIYASIRHWRQSDSPIMDSTYFFPPATAEYTFIADSIDGKLVLNGDVCEFLPSAGPGMKRVTSPQPMRQGDAVLMEFVGSLSLQHLLHSTPRGEEGFGERLVCPAKLARPACLILAHLERCINVAEMLGLAPVEVAFHLQRNMALSRLDPAQLVRLRSLARVRTQFSAPAASLVSYVRYLERALAAQDVGSSGEEGMMHHLLAETKRLTALDIGDISAFFAAQWPAASVKDLAKMLLDEDLRPLRRLAEACEMARSLGVPIATLHRWAQLPPDPQEPEDVDVVDEQTTALSSGTAVSTLAHAKEAVAAMQQQVLQEYLLRMPASLARGMLSPDDLSADLLIDVQMGPQMQVSRIGQATASVQLFVQRSFLGLEKVYGVPTTGVDQSLWAWMSKYTLWQANRKVFLYPENWVDPSLRDDKTQAFGELERKMLQASLDRDTISQLLREYVYAVHEVADLDVLSYLWESERDFRGRYHFFGRTRTAPFIFYYRQLVVTGTNTMLISWNWMPWFKMEVEIPTHEVDADQKPLSHPGSYLLPALFKRRLFLFIPQITRQAKPAAPLEKSMVDAAKKKEDGPSPATEYWEVKMAWVEMRNGKWSPKYVTATGIHVGASPGGSSGIKVNGGLALPSISSFRFRLETPNEGQSLAIHVDKWKEAAGGGLFETLGRFEMQGLRLRLMATTPGSPIGSLMDTQVGFGRITYYSSANSTLALKKEVEMYKVGIDPNTNEGQHSLLAVPNPKGTTAGDKYGLTWLLRYDTSQFKGVSGLVVERSTSTQEQLFFGFPGMTLEGEIDTREKTTISTVTLTHDSALHLVEEMADKEGYHAIFDALEHLPGDMVNRSFGFQNRRYRELAMPNSIYNWEMGFHAVALLMERLLATQQFDLALEVARLVFDPSRDDAELATTAPASTAESASTAKSASRKPLSRLDRSWRFIPFKSSDLRLGGSVRHIIQSLKPPPFESLEVNDWKANPFSPHAVARRRPAVYMKRFVMKYIEILIASGDQLFRQNLLDAVPLATQRYTEALVLFGPAPAAIDPPTRPVAKRYGDIQSLVNGFATASIDMELQFPHFINPRARGSPKPSDLRDSTLGFVRSTYFGIPANPQMKALRDLIDSRLYNIRHGLDINGNTRRLPLFDPPLDPRQLLTTLAAGASPLGLTGGGGAEGPMPNYRARYLLQKAQDLCAELRVLADSYLSIRERRDAEALARLRARQESGVLSLLAEVRRHQVQEATMAAEALAETRKSHVTRLRYFLALVGEPANAVPAPEEDWVDLELGIAPPGQDELRLSAEEWLEAARADDARHSSSVATGIEKTAGLLMALPSLTIQGQPMGIGVSTQIDASIVARSLLVDAGVVRAAAQESNDMAARAARKGQLVRQLQERRMQANLAGRDIKAVDRQAETQRKRAEAAGAELRAQLQQAADAAETETFLRTKYTSDQLYAWLEAETRRLGYRAYLAALDMARTAERALRFEYGPRAPPPPTLLAQAYWDESRDGLLAAQQLAAALHRMDRFRMQGEAHDYELVKTVSLRRVAPLALAGLRARGAAEFEIPEVLLDMDFPGHYCRRIKAVSVSMPNVVGPYVGVSCALQLLEHRYRLKPGPSSTGSYYRRDAADDERFHTDTVPISSVALSTCNRDSGTFELGFSGERYAPFEGAGVVSRWKLDLPSAFRQFDYNSIADVLFTIQFTALEGGAAWRSEATQAVRDFCAEVDDSLGRDGAFLLVDLAADFSTEWRQFGSRVSAASEADKKTPVGMSVGRIPHMLPFSTVGHAVKVQHIWAALQPAPEGWAVASGSNMNVLGSMVSEQADKSDENLKILGVDGNTAIDKGFADLSLTVSMTPEKLNQKAPKSCLLVIQYTQSS